MSQVIGWETIVCVCGRTDFVNLYEVLWHPKLGTTKKLSSAICYYCKRKLNTANAARDLTERYLERDIQEIRSEIEQLPGYTEDTPIEELSNQTLKHVRP